jgi:trigger factor
MEDYADTLNHDVNNITLLCPHHHQMKTSGRLSRSILLNANANPKNRDRELTEKCSIGLVDAAQFAPFYAGQSYFLYHVNSGTLLHCVTVDGEPVIGLVVEDGVLLLNLVLHNLTGSVALISDRGEVAVSTENWDYRLEGTTLSIRSTPGDIVVELVYKPYGIWLKRGHFVGQKGSILDVCEHAIRGTLPNKSVLTFESNTYEGWGIVISEKGFQV